MARGDGKDIILDDPALKLEGHLSVLAARAAVEHPTVATGHAQWSLRERTTKARTAFLGCPLARVGGGCIEEHRSALNTWSPRMGLYSRHGTPAVVAVTAAVASGLRGNLRPPENF